MDMHGAKLTTPKTFVGCNQQKRKKPKKPKKRNNATLQSSNKMESCKQRLCAAACSQVDPFCNNCLEGIYDPNTSRVVRFAVRDVTSMTTDVNGSAYLEITPSWKDGRRIATAITSGSTTTFGSYTSYPFYNATEYDSYRIISMGVRFVAQIDPMSAKGVVQLFTMDNPPTTNVNLTVEYLYKNCKVFKLFNGDVTWVNKSKGGSKDFSTLDEPDYSDNWETLGIGITGAPASTTVARVEIYFNIEVMPRQGSTGIIHSLTVDAKPSIPEIVNAASNALIKAPSFVDNTTDKKSHSETLLGLVEQGFVSLATTYGPQLLEGLAMMLF